ncbi:MAG: LCP family protein [Micropruina sp.]|uniref:LCP family protein n=1 Tax=Micropruina sp. TaxID=2737536 RepID=UPI0039E33455
MRSRSDRLVAVATLGAFVVVTGVLGLVSLYLGAVTQALSEVPRSSPLPDYPGRPSPSVVADAAAPLRYLVLATDNDGLASVQLAQLSAGRDRLQLLGLPSNLLVPDAAGAETTLTSLFAANGGAGVLRSVEALLGTRIDHLVQLRLDTFLQVIDVIGEVRVQNEAERSAGGWNFPSGELPLSAREAVVYLTSNRQPMTELRRTEEVFVEILRGVVSGDALTSPAKVEKIGTILRGCVTVDAGLTPGEIRRTAIDVHLAAESIVGIPLPMEGVSQLNGAPVTVADQTRLAELAGAIATDEVDIWAGRQTDPWRSLPTLPPR